MTIEKFKLMIAAMGSKDIRRLWLVENPRLRERLPHLGNGHWRAGWYETISPQEDCPVECLEVRNGFGLRMGWSFLYHLPGIRGAPPFSEIRELFVWPTLRRMGIGTELEAWAAERATEFGSEELRLVLNNEADATLGPGSGRAMAGHSERDAATSGSGERGSGQECDRA
jgi:GNAT superfamily N-acetyltransferase